MTSESFESFLWFNLRNGMTTFSRRDVLLEIQRPQWIKCPLSPRVSQWNRIITNKQNKIAREIFHSWSRSAWNFDGKAKENIQRNIHKYVITCMTDIEWTRRLMRICADEHFEKLKFNAYIIHFRIRRHGGMNQSEIFIGRVAKKITFQSEIFCENRKIWTTTTSMATKKKITCECGSLRDSRLVKLQCIRIYKYSFYFFPIHERQTHTHWRKPGADDLILFFFLESETYVIVSSIGCQHWTIEHTRVEKINQ